MSRAAGRRLRVVFRVAAGPKQGFGHLVRARVLSRALGIRRPVVSVRGNAQALDVAQRLGFHLAHGSAPQILDAHRPAVVVIDDPTAASARVWTRSARRRGLPTASVHDLGRGFCGADLSVDGSLVRTRWPRRARTLVGPRFAILDARLVRMTGTPRDRSRVLIALGGGPRAAVAARVAESIVRVRPALRVRIAAGFVPTAMRTTPGVTWLKPQQGLARELARCGAALVGGGVSLYEAAAIGTPVAVWPVVAAQSPTARAFVRRGNVTAVWPGSRRSTRAAQAICDLLDHPPMPSRLLDGLGAVRVARAIRQLAGTTGAAR